MSLLQKIHSQVFRYCKTLSKLTAHDAIFIWCEECELSFQMLKDTLVSAPILKYPDTSKPYTVFTDASKYGWARVLTKEHTSMVDGKEITTKHRVMYVSGLFLGSQLNWAAMTKEAYAIYMTVKKSTFYITGHDLTLRSDHLPLNKFLKQMMLNNTVNNWAMEIENFKIKFLHIAGKDNILAGTLSRLIDINPDVELQPKLKDYEFGHYAFETLPKAKSKMVHEILTSLEVVNVCKTKITYDNLENSPYSVKLLLSNEKFSCLQDKDLKVSQLKQKVIQG